MAETDEIFTLIKRAFELKEQTCYKQAIEMLYKAIAIEPDNTDIMLQLGELYYLLENYPRAIQYGEQIISKDSGNLSALTLLKNVYLKQNEFYLAKEITEKIYSKEPTEDNLEILINIYGKLELFNEIDNRINEIEKSEKCLLSYAKNLYNSSKIEKAYETVHKILEINPDNEDAVILKGKILFDRNETEKAKEIFSKFDKYTQNPEVLNYQGLFALEEMRFTDAIKLFSKAVNLDKKNSLYSYNLGNAYFFNGWYKEAVNAYKEAIILNPENTDYRYSLAYMYYEHEEYDKSYKEVEYILNINNNHSNTKVLKALLLSRKGEFLEAEKILLSNIQSGFEDEFTLSSLAKIELELGKIDNAEKYMLSAIEKSPDNVELRLDLGEIYIKEKQYSKAIDIAKRINFDSPNFVDGYILGAKASFENNMYEEAKQFAQNALSLDINCSQGYYYLALVRKFENDLEEAIECMKRAIMHDLSNPKYYAEMADLYKLSGDNKSAFEYIKEAESIDHSEEYRQLFREYAALNRK